MSNSIKINTKLTPFYKEVQESKAGGLSTLTILITHNKLDLNINFLDFNHVNLDLIFFVNVLLKDLWKIDQIFLFMDWTD